MNSFLRQILLWMITTATLMALWLITPSSLFVQPISLGLKGNKLTIIRETPLGDVTVNWIGEIYLIGREGFECAGQGTSIIQTVPDDLYTGTIGAWAKPCLEEGPPFILRFQYSAQLFGIIPLRPVHFATTVNPQATP
jgi:hypothetical protein